MRAMAPYQSACKLLLSFSCFRLQLRNISRMSFSMHDVCVKCHSLMATATLNNANFLLSSVLHLPWPAGASGFVQLAHDGKTGEEVAIKFVPRGSPYLHRAAEREILNHRLLAGHAHIVQFREVWAVFCHLLYRSSTFTAACAAFSQSGRTSPATTTPSIQEGRRQLQFTGDGISRACCATAACSPCKHACGKACHQLHCNCLVAFLCRCS